MAANRRTISKTNANKRKKTKSQSVWSRLNAVPKPVVAGLWVLAFGAIGTKMLFFSGATAFQYVGVHPQAVNQPEASSGQQLKSLAAWNGKVYAGYGDWDRNTGPVSLTPYNSATNSFAASPEHVADTESIEIWKTIGKKLFAVHVDPKSHNGAAYSVADASSGATVWANVFRPTVTHAYGMTVGANESELFLAGQLDEGVSTNEVAKVFRSVDGGATWTQSLSVPSRGGYNRMMFISKLGDKIYAQNLSTTDFSSANVEAKAWVFNGSSWSKVTPIAGTYQPFNGNEFAGRILAQTSPQGGSLVAYDGRSTTTVRPSTRDYKIHTDGYVYALTYNNSKMSVMRSKDVATWELVTPAPNTSRSIALEGTALYIGTYDSELYKAEVNPLVTDSVPPTASLLVPTTAYTVTKANEFAVNASDPASIDRVEFYVGANRIGSVSSKASNISGCFGGSCFSETATYPGSYSMRWNGSGVAAGNYSFKAIAYDIYGNSTETASVPMTVPEGLYPPDVDKPVITVTSPRAGDRIRKNVWVTASASDNSSIASMDVQIDGALVMTTSSASVNKSFPVSRGSHSLLITARDRAGNIAQYEQTFSSR